ncbi:MAG: two-component system, OmpR family, sensor histidine kinase BaeS [Chloroflexota bacterium]|nr:two-component system, OmpR family, sensor histidine kinase BaeS [Chloroflexota bacterium]
MSRSSWWRPQGIAMRIALLSLLVTAVAVAIIAIGVLGVAQASFNRLMLQAGQSAATARAMFDHSVLPVFIVAAAIAGAVSLLLASLLAIWLAGPLDDIARAARRVARGEYQARVHRKGPDEVTSLADSFNQMAESLEQQERMRRDFIVNAAHELSTPLTNLQGYLEALRDGVIAPSTEQFQSLHEEVDRLVRLSQSLNTLAQDRSPSGGSALETIDLVPAVRAAVELARPTFDGKGIRVQLHLPERLPARAVPDQLSQVLANLLQNASRYTPDGGMVTVSAEARRSDVLVSVTNTGDGIPDLDLPHIFERFYRVEKSRDRAHGGAGIGLAIVKQLVEATGGRVGAESQAGVTRFWFSLPA